MTKHRARVRRYLCDQHERQQREGVRLMANWPTHRRRATARRRRRHATKK